MSQINQRYDNHIEIQTANLEFESFHRNFLKYPEIKDRYLRLIEVDLEFRIDKNNIAFDILPSSIELDRPRMLHQNERHKKTKESEFLKCATNLVKEFKGWKAYRLNNRYVNNITYISIPFSYHSEYFNDPDNLILNPDFKPFYAKKSCKYERIIENKFGCDGIMNVLSIVESDGTLTNLEIIGHEGKISGQFAIDELISLGNWTPARHNNINVRSQLDLLIYI